MLLRIALTFTLIAAAAPALAQQDSYADADAELNQLYQQLESRLMERPDAKRELVAAQRAWIAFRDAECRFAASGVEGGSVYQQALEACLRDRTETRIRGFSKYLNCPEGDTACPVPLASAAVSAQTTADVNGTLDSLFGAHAPYQKFFEDLKKAVASGDKATVAAMVDYPFQARIGGKAAKLKDAAHFIADYDKIMTAKVKQAVAAQSYETLFANWQGVSIGDGEIWFSGTGKNSDTIKIIAIND